MNPIWLIRHAEHDWIGKALVGRKSGVPLNSEGRLQALRIAERLACEPITAVISSPQQRAVETARPLADALGLPLQTDQRLDEIDFGLWTGITFPNLDKDPRWHEWNRQRSRGIAPGGESMLAAQRRMLAALREYGAHGQVAMVSHADVIKAAIVNYLQMSLDELLSLSVEPGDIIRLLPGESPPLVYVESRETKIAAPL